LSIMSLVRRGPGRALGALLAIGAARCGAAPPATVTSAGVGRVEVVGGGPLAPPRPRLRAALAELGELVGHPVDVLVDAALLPDEGALAEHAILEGVERTVQHFARLRQTRRLVFDHGAPRVRILRCRYRAAAAEASGALDLARATLVVTLPPDAGSLVPYPVVDQALERAYLDHARARYEHLAAGAVPEPEHEAYFRHWSAPRSGDDAAGAVLRVVELSARVRDAALGNEVRAWLAGRGLDFFAPALRREPAAACGTGGLGHAFAGWGRWAQEHFDTLAPAARGAALEGLLVRIPAPTGAPERRLRCDGADPLALGLRIVDDWRAGSAAGPELRALHARVVCPRDASGPAAGCGWQWWDWVLGDPTDRQRLFAAVRERGDAALIVHALRTAYERAGGEVAVALWRSLEGEPESWLTATRAIADHVAESAGVEIVAEARRLWPTAATSTRGALLHVLLRHGTSEEKVAWRSFPADFDGAVSADALDAALGWPGTLADVARLWPALGRGWSRAEVLVPHLERALVAAPEPRSSAAVERILAALCAEGAVGDLARLHRLFAGRVLRGERALASLADHTRPGTCGASRP
jgi:hypothetical protein